MVENNKYFTVSNKIKKIISKYYKVEVFNEVAYSFYPICIVQVEDSTPTTNFTDLQSELKKIGFQIKFFKPKVSDLKKYNLEHDETITRFILGFEAKDFSESPAKLKKDTKIQIILLGITSILIVFSAYFYILFVEPYYGSSYKSDPYGAIWFIFYFCIGIFSIIIVHEFGHILFARIHKLETSYPFLIPGPPPFGMLGAFVKIKEDPQTRNQKFDVAVGGIIFGIIISTIFVIIGLLLSEQVDTNTYLNLRAKYSGKTPSEEAQRVSESMNLYNLLFLALRFLMFDPPTYGTYYGCTLPDKILVIHPLAYAGWIGLMLSCLNLIPLPFLDGGHVLKTIFPGRYTRLIGLLIGTAVYFIIMREISSILILLITLSCVSIAHDLDPSKRHAVVPNPSVPLSKSRKIFSVCLLVFIVLLFPLSFDNLIFGIGF